MAERDPFGRLVQLLARLEDARPYVTVDDLCARWTPRDDTPTCRELVRDAIADRRLFTDQRQRVDPASGAIEPVRLVRLNRRHPAVADLLD